MPTTVTRSIGTSSRDYSTLQSWEDAAPADLVSADEIWKGECYNDTEFTSAGSLLTIAGSTTDSTRYKWLTAAAGQSFADHASVQSNALKYNASNGVGIRTTGNYLTSVTVSEAYARLSRLQFTGASSDTSIPLSVSSLTSRFSACIIDNRSTSSSAAAAIQLAAAVVSNCLIIKSGGTQYVVQAISGSLNATWDNVTLVSTSGSSTPSRGVSAPYGTLNLYNCAFFGATAPAAGGATVNKTNCYTDATATGWTTVAYDTSTGSGFQGITTAGQDFRLKATSGLIGVGSAHSPESDVDIAGTARPSGGSYDVGCWEYVSATAVPTITFVGAENITSTGADYRVTLDFA